MNSKILRFAEKVEHVYHFHKIVTSHLFYSEDMDCLRKFSIKMSMNSSMNLLSDVSSPFDFKKSLKNLRCVLFPLCHKAMLTLLLKLVF